MSFMYRTSKRLGVTTSGRITEADDPQAIGEIPEGKLIPIDDAERLGLTTEAAERKKANRGQPLAHKFTEEGAK